MSHLINLTPHSVDVITEEGVVSIPSTGLARCTQSSEIIGSVGDIPLARTTFGEVEGLPPQEDGVLYIVSGLVISALKARGVVRNDLVQPIDFVRDGAGKILGCRALSFA